MCSVSSEASDEVDQQRISRQELEKMTKAKLMDHLSQHGKTGDLIDLIIKDGFDVKPKTQDDQTGTSKSSKPDMSYKTAWKKLIPGIHVDSDLEDNPPDEQPASASVRNSVFHSLRCIAIGLRLDCDGIAMGLRWDCD